MNTVCWKTMSATGLIWVPIRGNVPLHVGTVNCESLFWGIFTKWYRELWVQCFGTSLNISHFTCLEGLKLSEEIVADLFYLLLVWGLSLPTIRGKVIMRRARDKVLLGWFIRVNNNTEKFSPPNLLKTRMYVRIYLWLKEYIILWKLYQYSTAYNFFPHRDWIIFIHGLCVQ
jgi:hypothetical protein